MILIPTLPITGVLHLKRSTFLHWMIRKKIDLTIEKENRKPKNRKRKSAVSSESKRNKTKLLRNTRHAYRNYKRSTEIYEQKIRPPCMATWRLKCVSKFSKQESVDIFKNYWSLGDINARRILSLNVLMSHQASVESFWWNCFRMCN